MTWAKKQDPLGGTYVSPVTWAKKKQDPLGGTYVSPRDVGKKKDSLGGTYVSPRDVGTKKKQDPLGGTYVSPRDVGKKKRLTRGDVCLTQRRGHTKKKQDPLGGTYVSPRDVGKKKQDPCGVGGTNSTLSPPTGLRRRGVLMPLPFKGDMGANPVPQIRREGLIVAPPFNLPC